MKTLLRTALMIAAPAFAALFLGSCVYDPYSYGYGGTGYDTGGSVLIATSSSYWGYDPYRYCYYDYRRHCYYDPYLGGYYRPGYRPPAIAGCPHPGGWRPGHGVCPPPRNPRNHNLAHNLNRVDQLRATNYAWRNQVHQNQQTQLAHMRANQDAWRNRVQAQRTPSAGPAGGTVQRTRTPSPWLGGGRTITPTPGRTTTPSGGQGIRGGGNHGGGGQIQPGNRGQSTRQANLPVNTGQQQAAQAQAQAAARAQSQAAARAQSQAAAQSRIQAAQDQQRARIEAARQNAGNVPAGGGRGRRR